MVTGRKFEPGLNTWSTWTVLLCVSLSFGQTVRHHKVAVEDPSQPPELHQAEAAIDKEDYATAEPLLRKVVAADPKNYLAWFDLGFLYNALGKPEDSIAAYQQSVKANPEVFESNLNLGLMMSRYQKPGAENFLRAATRLKPTDHVDEGQARAWIALAQALEKTNPDEAIDAYRQAAQLQPRDPEPHLAAGLLLERANKLADAEQEYKQALALNSSSADAIVGLANIYMRGRRFAEAENYLRKVVALRPGDSAPHLQLGRVLAADGKNDQAIAELQAGLKLAPDDVAAQRDLAEVYFNAARYADAEAAYRSQLARNPNDPDLHLALGQALMKQHKFQQAEAEFLSAVQLKPDRGEAYGELAIAANESQNYSLAIRALDERAKFLPEIPMTYFMRATAYDHLRDYRQASANYRIFLQVANGRYPDQEWQARHRLIAIGPKK
ncbi:MAG TPA: tetratricopeptide repeat protein [Terriglobales bacterium]|nr:tetratricopeptide repeat protein [Terriglobales bacterium]